MNSKIYWASSRENLSSGVHEQHRRRPACAYAQSDQRLCYSLSGTGPRSAVGNVSGYRCVSDCRSRGREFDPGPVPYFRGD